MPVNSTRLSMRAGDYQTLTVTITDVNSSVVDISDSAISWNLSKDFNFPTLFSKSSTASTEIAKTNSSAGICTIYLNSSDTVNLNGVYYFDASIIDGSSHHITVLDGYITIRRAQ